MSPTVLQSFWMLAAGAFYTLLAICIKWGVDTYSVYEIVFYRSAFGIFMVLYLLKQKGIPIATPMLGTHILRNALATTNLCLGAYIMWLLPLAMAQILNYTCPLFFASWIVAEMLVAGRRINWGLLGALICGFLGVCLIIRPDVGEAMLLPMLLGLIVGATGGSADWIVKKMGERGEPAERIVFWFVVAGLIVGFAGIVLGDGFHPLDMNGFLILLGVGVFGTLGQYTMTLALKNGEAFLNSVLQYSGVVFSIIAGIFIFGDSLDMLTFIGIAVICLSGIASTILTVIAKRD